MQIKLVNIKIKDLVNGYFDNGNGGVIGYGGKLDIRPAYQREFVYKDDKRNKVIETVRNSFPLNVMYWVDKGNGTYEILDGQQRTISICQYINGAYSVDNKYYHNLPSNKKQEFDDYELMVYICTGTDSEKQDWFRTINIAGEQLTEQELRNAIYTGEWLTSAKSYFSQNNCVAYQMGKVYLDGTPIRQDYLETALKWISHAKYGKENIEKYMSSHQNDNDDSELRTYFQDVITWVQTLFTVKRREMNGIKWGILYNNYKTKVLVPSDVEEQLKNLLQDKEVQKKSGVYEYILTGNESCLNLRAFSEEDRIAVFNMQMSGSTGKATCPRCNDNTKLYSISEMQADHIIPWSKGGKTEIENCQMLCKKCNATKSDKY